MRIWISALAIALAVLVAVPAAASTSAQSGVEEPAALKKKKAAALKAQARLKADLKEKAEARKKAALALEKRRAERKIASRSGCRGFFKCLFGEPRVRVVKTRTGSRVADQTTAEVVKWSEAARYAPGTIVVRTPERALYYVLDGKKAKRYSVGVGREGFQWSGNAKIVAKQEWPTWRPPEAMIEREAAKGHMLPDVMEGGPGNPLGARALYIGGTMYRIHGNNDASSIGGAVSSGCIRMMNSDVVELYKLVKVGAPIHVYQ